MAFTQTTRLTNNQKSVLSKIKSSPTPVIAFGEIAKGDDNLIKAKNMLADPQQFDPPLIIVDGNKLTVSDAGEQMMKDENLIDDSGQLTDSGKNLAYGSNNSQQPDNMDGGSPLGGETDINPVESYNLINLINSLVNLQK